MNEEDTQPCPRCRREVDDLWRVRRNGKAERMCPGCVADRRGKGDEVEVVSDVR